MKKARDRREKREKDLKSSCISSGVMFIIVGLIGALFSVLSVNDGEYGQLVPIYLFCALAIGVGIYMLFAPKDILKNEADEKDPETVQYAQIMKRRERAHKKMRSRCENENKSLKRELFGRQAFYALVIGLIFLPLTGLYFILSLGAGAVPIVVFMLILIGLLIYLGYGFGYNSLKKYAERNGIDFSAVEEDFRHSSVYSGLNSFISIGCTYTVFISEGHRYIMENKRITSVSPFYEKVDNFTTGLYSGTTTVYSVIIKTDTGNTYKVVCEEFAEELIIEDFARNKYFMNDDFSAVYKDNSAENIPK